MLTRLILTLMVLGVLSGTVLPGPVQANDQIYYVDALLPGSDSNSGLTEALPFRTLAKCSTTAINPGDQCWIKNGTYAQTVQILFGYSGTPGHPIVWKNYPGHTPIISWGTFVDPIVDFTLRLLISDHANSLNSVHDGVIQGLEITGGAACIKYDKTDHFLIQGNNLHHCGDGVLGQGSSLLTIDGNRVWHNGQFNRCATTPATCNQDHGLYVQGQSMKIINNLIWDNLANGVVAVGHVAGTSGTSTDPLFAGFNNGLIANNTIAYNNYGTGVNVWDVNIQNLAIENNIFFQNARLVSSGSGADGILWTSPGSSTGSLINNISYGTAGSATRFAISSLAGNVVPTGWTLSGNCPTADTGNCATSPFPALLATISGTPNFAIDTTSNAVKFGVNLTTSFTDDFLGNIRQPAGNWDAGAYALLGVTRYVSLGGHGETSVSDTNTCVASQSILTPKRTFASALPCISPGDTLFIRDAVYAEQINLNSPTKINGTLGNPITIAGYPTDVAPVLRRTSSPDAYGPIQNFAISSTLRTEYQVFRHLVLDGINEANLSGWQHKTNGPGTAAEGAVDSGYYHDVILDDIEYKNFPLNMYAEANNLTIRNSKIHDQRSVSGAAGERWTGLYFKRGANLLYENNDVYNNPGGGMQLYCGTATTGTTISGAIIRNTRLHDNNFLAAGVSFTGGMVLYGPCFSNIKVYNNLIYNNGSAPTHPDAPGITLGSNASNVELDNNTIYGNRRGGGTNASGIDLEGPTNSTNVVLKGNILFGNIGTPQYSNLSIGTVTQGNIGIDLVTDPLFVNAGGLDFHLSAGSPARNYAPNLSSLFTTDFSGVVRPAGNWDAGALQSILAGVAYYVRQGGSDGNLGTTDITGNTSGAWATLLKAAATMNCGDTTYVHAGAGAYIETGEVRFSKTTNCLGNKITLRNFPGETPAVTWSAASFTAQTARIAVRSSSSNTVATPDVTVQGLNIGPALYCVKLSGSLRFTFTQNICHDTSNSAFEANNVEGASLNTTVTRNVFVSDGLVQSPKGHCMYLTGQGFVIAHNLFVKCGFYGVQMDGGLGTAGAPGPNYGTFQGIIANNTFAWSQDQAGIVAWTGFGTGITQGPITNTTIVNNIFLNMAQTATGASQVMNYQSCASCDGTVTKNAWFTLGANNQFSISSTGSTPVAFIESLNLNLDPRFANAPSTFTSSYDLHLTSFTPSGVLAGTNLTGTLPPEATIDLDGVQRSSSGSWPMGAYDATVQPDTTPPAANTGFRVR